MSSRTIDIPLSANRLRLIAYGLGLLSVLGSVILAVFAPPAAHPYLLSAYVTGVLFGVGYGLLIADRATDKVADLLVETVSDVAEDGTTTDRTVEEE